MAFDLESSKTFGELILDLSVRVGCAYHGEDGEEQAQIPVDEEDLRKCMDAVNKGYKLFLRSDNDWSFATETHTIITNPDGTGPDNIAGDPARYRLPVPIRRAPMRGGLVFTDTTANKSAVKTWAERFIMERRQAGIQLGCPQLAGYRPIPRDNLGDDPLESCKPWELIFWPTPDSVYTLEGEFRVVPYDLVTMEEHHVAGADHDYAILAAANYCWYQDDSEDAEKAGRYERDWITALDQSKKLDRQARRKSGRILRDPGARPVSVPRTPRGFITHINDSRIPQ